jgi:HEAT repeat protein
MYYSLRSLILVPALAVFAPAGAQTVEIPVETKVQTLVDINGSISETVAIAMAQDKVRAVVSGQQAAVEATARAEAARSVYKYAGQDGDYNRAMRMLDQRKWEEALTVLKKVTGERADAALYWSAYAQAKLGRRDEALATLATLKGQSGSRWLNDAAALEVEVRQASGQIVSPDTEADDDTRLMALNGVMATDPDRALPILQKMISGAQSPRVKERAMFVLSQNDSPKGRELLVQFAKGAGNPDLQRQAVRALGFRGAKSNQPVLAEIYQSTSDKAIKREVLMALMNTGDKERLVNLVKTEKDPGLRGDAIRQVGMLGDQKFLLDLYASETDANVKTQIAYAVMTTPKGSEPLINLTNSEKDPAVRLKLIKILGTFSADKTGPALVQLYSKDADKGTRSQVLVGLFTQGNAKALIEIARAESDPELKRLNIRYLSTMRSKDASDFLLEYLSKDSGK